MGRRHRGADLVEAAPLEVRILLLSKEIEAGRAGMAVGAEFDRATGVLKLLPDTPVSIAMVLTREDAELVRIVVQDALTGAVVGESRTIPVKLNL